MTVSMDSGCLASHATAALQTIGSPVYEDVAIADALIGSEENIHGISETRELQIVSRISVVYLQIGAISANAIITFDMFPRLAKSVITKSYSDAAAAIIYGCKGAVDAMASAFIKRADRACIKHISTTL